FDLLTNRNMQLIDFTLTGRMLELPHPLLADNINFQGILRWTILGKINLCSPREDAHRNDQGNDRPECLQFRRTFDGPRDLEWIAAPIADDKENDDQRDQGREKNGHAGDIEIEGVNVARQG